MTRLIRDVALPRRCWATCCHVIVSNTVDNLDDDLHGHDIQGQILHDLIIMGNKSSRIHARTSRNRNPAGWLSVSVCKCDINRRKS